MLGGPLPVVPQSAESENLTMTAAKKSSGKQSAAKTEHSPGKSSQPKKMQ